MEVALLERPTQENSLEEKELDYLRRFKDAFTGVEAKTISEDQYANAVVPLENMLHEKWLATYKAKPDNYENGELKPRWKPFNDPEWQRLAETENHPYKNFFRINPENGKTEVDISGLRNSELPKQPREENQQAAKFAIDKIREAKKEGAYPSRSLLDQYSDEVHQEWQRRNASWASGDLMKPYKDIPLEEQLKDMEHLVLAAEILADIKA